MGLSCEVSVVVGVCFFFVCVVVVVVRTTSDVVLVST